MYNLIFLYFKFHTLLESYLSTTNSFNFPSACTLVPFQLHALFLFLYFLRFLIYFDFVSMEFCPHVCMKKASHPMDPELQSVVNPHVVVGAEPGSSAELSLQNLFLLLWPHVQLVLPICKWTWPSITHICTLVWQKCEMIFLQYHLLQNAVIHPWHVRKLGRCKFFSQSL